MPAEELIQRGYLKEGKLKGEKFGNYELLEIGATSINELYRLNALDEILEIVDFPFNKYKVPKKSKNAKPDSIFLRRIGEEIKIVASRELKQPKEFNSQAKIDKAIEQGIFSAAVMKAPISIVTDGTTYHYIDVSSSLDTKTIVEVEEYRDFNPAVLESLLASGQDSIKNPGILAEKVWQAIWHATKEEPKQCLMTFVEIFILKFLSDNLPETIFPSRYTFYELVKFKEDEFKKNYGKSQIEYYVQEIRSKIKSIFKEKEVVTNSLYTDLFGIKTIVSPTSLINGFAFLKSGETSIETFNRTFLEILGYFNEFGGLQNIDPEFKLRLYETFLKKTVRQQKLGQFFTPRNIVKAIIKMAQLDKLAENSIVFDPAAGVGGFVLEPLIQKFALENNFKFNDGNVNSKIKLVGADCDINTNILAKANMLIHLSEEVRNPHATIESLNKLLAETFLVLNTNQHLGTLEYPIKEKVDVILTNPPYVTQGSKIYKEEIINTKGLRNGVDLKDYYDRSGLGLESLFLRYISGALKPGGRAFVIVPQGLLTRTETSTKDKILADCNLLASISLPRNAFYSTPQKTYLIVIEKRKTKVGKRPPVFCAIATSLGESLDARRIPLPLDNDLDKIAECFIEKKWTPKNFGDIATKIKIVESENFTSSDRWDVYQFWSDSELVSLGEREEAVSRVNFLEEVQEKMSSIIEEISLIQNEIKELTKGNMKSVSLADENLFRIRRGKRVTRKNGDQNPGPIPVYSGSKDPLRPLCSVNEEFANINGIPIENSPIITVNANGFVGAVFMRDEKCIIHDDVMIIDVIDKKINMEFVVHSLRASVAEGNYEYEAKLYSRVKELKFDIPVDSKSRFDIKQQNIIAIAYKKFEILKATIGEIGLWANESRIKE
jgi:type I restriction-modification system DNA methylase subunit